jgi:alkylation response protein AidB-like acyl-CoA dehydrogenase
VNSREIDADRQLPPQVIAALRKGGVYGGALPKEYGNILEYVFVIKHI